MEDLRKYAVTYGKASSPIGTGDAEENDNDNNNDNNNDKKIDANDSNNINVAIRLESSDGKETESDPGSVLGTGPGSGVVRVLGRIIPIAKSKEIDIQTFHHSLSNTTEKNINKLPLDNNANDEEIGKEVEISVDKNENKNENIFDSKLKTDFSSLPPLYPISTSSPSVLSLDPAIHRNSTLNSTLKSTSTADSDLVSTTPTPPSTTTSFTTSSTAPTISSSTPNAISSVMAAASTFYTTSFSTFSMSSRQLKSQEGEIEKEKGEDGQRQCRQIDVVENMKDHDNNDDNKNDNDKNNDEKNIKIDDYNVTTTISSYLPLLSTSSSSSSSTSTSTSKAIPTSTQAPTSEQSEPSGQIPVPSLPIVMVPPGRIIHIYKENGKNV